MNNMLSWVYKDPRTGGNFKITCRSFIRYDGSGKAVYGEPFQIDGYMKDQIKEISNDDGSVSVSTREYITDSTKIKINDLVGGRRVVFVILINTFPLDQVALNYRILAE